MTQMTLTPPGGLGGGGGENKKDHYKSYMEYT